MFDGCSSLASIDLNHFNTTKVISFDRMFKDCSALLDLTITNFSTATANSMEEMFKNCSSLNILNIENFITSNVYNMKGMFEGCSSLSTIDLLNFDTYFVENMDKMFKNCSGLRELELMSFNTGNLTSAIEMFSGCENLNNIYVTLNFVTDQIEESESMFYNCIKLPNFDDTKIDKEMAYINGYFSSYSGGGVDTTPSYIVQQYIKWKDGQIYKAYPRLSNSIAGIQIIDQNSYNNLINPENGILYIISN